MGRFNLVKSKSVPKLKELFTHPVAKNAVSLYAIQFADFILPLVTVPYLVRVLGPTNFGIVAFCQGLITYFTVFIEYGFPLSVTRSISVNREDQEFVNRKIFDVWTAKFLLLLLGLLILLCLIFTVPKVKEVYPVMLALYAGNLAYTLMPVWLYQGMEQMTLLMYASLFGRLVMTFAIFIFIKEKSDYLMYAWILTGSSFISAIFSFLASFKVFKLKIYVPRVRGVFDELREGWTLFISNASLNIHSAGNAFILGLFTNNTIVGYYSGAEKIIRGFLGFIFPLSQAVYPRISKLAIESKKAFFVWVKRILIVLGLAGFLISLTTFLTAPLIVRLLLGSEFNDSIIILKYLSPIPFLIALGNVMAIQILLPLKKDRQVTVVFILAALINIILAIILVSSYKAVGSASAFVLSEFFIVVTMALCIYKYVKRSKK